MNLWRKAPRALRWLVIGSVSVVALAVAGLVLAQRDADNEPAADRDIVEVPAGTDRGVPAGNRFRVPADRVPRSVQDAQSSPQIELTPGRWAADPENAGGQDVARNISAAARRDAVNAAGRFLRLWETFPAFKTNGDWIAYQNKLRPLVTPEALSDIVRRADNHAPSFICASQECVGGSKQVIYPGYAGPADTAEVRSYDPGTDSVYLIMWGSVRYSGPHPLRGDEFNRSYGIILKRVDGQWLVTRAAGDTIGPAL